MAVWMNIKLTEEDKPQAQRLFDLLATKIDEVIEALDKEYNSKMRPISRIAIESWCVLETYNFLTNLLQLEILHEAVQDKNSKGFDPALTMEFPPAEETSPFHRNKKS